MSIGERQENAPGSHNWTWSDSDLNTLLERATHRLGELNAFSLHVPDIDIFIRMHVAKEAATSSRIEGTQTKVEKALQAEKDIPPEQRNDWHEVQNYIDAINHAVRQIAKLPVSTRLIHEAHRKLMRACEAGRNSLENTVGARAGSAEHRSRMQSMSRRHTKWSPR